MSERNLRLVPMPSYQPVTRYTRRAIFASLEEVQALHRAAELLRDREPAVANHLAFMADAWLTRVVGADWRER